MCLVFSILIVCLLILLVQEYKFKLCQILESYMYLKSKKISNDQELTQSHPISCPQNKKGNTLINKLTEVYESRVR